MYKLYKFAFADTAGPCDLQPDSLHYHFPLKWHCPWIITENNKICQWTFWKKLSKYPQIYQCSHDRPPLRFPLLCLLIESTVCQKCVQVTPRRLFDLWFSRLFLSLSSPLDRSLAVRVPASWCGSRPTCKRRQPVVVTLARRDEPTIWQAWRCPLHPVKPSSVCGIRTRSS